MADPIAVAADRQQLDDLAHEFLALVHEPSVPRGVLCAVWLRLGLALGDHPDCRCGLHELIRLGAIDLGLGEAVVE